jgi:asparagine synthase (glutamine-hydrolysing)
MCGIAGIISKDPNFIQRDMLQSICAVLAYRGPDGNDSWQNEDNTVGFSHTRLSIIDLSAAAAQPMHYLGRYTIVYNGEIYNYIEIRRDLKKAGYQFKTQSDTEVIMAAYDFYGQDCVCYFDGMFAFAIWDQQEKRLFAARDRFGEKPFYYFHEKEKFFFGSEMKALWEAGIPRLMNRKMLLNYFALGSVQNPSDKSQTFFQHIFSLLPAHCLIYEAETAEYSIHPYWQLDTNNQSFTSGKNYVETLNELLSESILRRLRSDVQVGCSLSGGLDSSSIAAMVTAMLGSKKAGDIFKTYSAVFPGFEKNEESFIDDVARHLQLTNYKTSPAVDGLINDFEKLCYHQEEPFPSSSIYAQYKVMELAASHGTKVLLDGQGADETMAGYHKYLHWYLQELLRSNRFFALKKTKSQFAAHNISIPWGVKNFLAALLPAQASITLEKREYASLTHNQEVSKSLLNEIKGREWDGIYKPIVTKLNDILYFNTMESGLEELLRFADRNSMAHGVEIRLPFLNAQLVQFLFNTPSSLKINEGYTKWILRKSMDKKLPDSIVWRTDKVGYEPPQRQWMENARMIDFMQESKRKLVQHDLLRPQVLEKSPLPRHAHDKDNFDWRYLCAAQLL